MWPKGGIQLTLSQASREIFDDARSLYDSAIERLDAADVRDAAEEAWGATKRATDALVLALTGTEPGGMPGTTVELRRLIPQHPQVESLVGQYANAREFLHGQRFYMDITELLGDTERRIRGTIDYVRTAEELAASEE